MRPLSFLMKDLGMMIENEMKSKQNKQHTCFPVNLVEADGRGGWQLSRDVVYV